MKNKGKDYSGLLIIAGVIVAFVALYFLTVSGQGGQASITLWQNDKINTGKLQEGVPFDINVDMPNGALQVADACLQNNPYGVRIYYTYELKALSTPTKKPLAYVSSPVQSATYPYACSHVGDIPLPNAKLSTPVMGEDIQWQITIRYKEERTMFDVPKGLGSETITFWTSPKAVYVCTSGEKQIQTRCFSNTPNAGAPDSWLECVNGGWVSHKADCGITPLYRCGNKICEWQDETHENCPADCPAETEGSGSGGSGGSGGILSKVMCEAAGGTWADSGCKYPTGGAVCTPSEFDCKEINENLGGTANYVCTNGEKTLDTSGCTSLIPSIPVPTAEETCAVLGGAFIEGKCSFDEEEAEEQVDTCDIPFLKEKNDEGDCVWSLPALGVSLLALLVIIYLAYAYTRPPKQRQNWAFPAGPLPKSEIFFGGKK